MTKMQLKTDILSVTARLILMAMIAAASLSLPARDARAQGIDQLEFRETSVGEAIRLIARLSGVNIFATREAASREFSMTVTDTDVRGVVSSIARVSGLSFSFDRTSNAYILMTNEQFANDVVITRNAETKVFNLRHQNVVSAAQVVKSLFGSRVQLNLNTDDPDRLEIPDGSFQSTRSIGGNSGQGDDRRRAANNGGRGGSSATSSDGEIDPNEINPDRLRELVGVEGRGILELSELTDRLGLEPPIFITINREHNLLYVRTSDREALKDIQDIIRETDRPTKQVLLEVKIMSLNLSEDFGSNFNFGLSGSQSTYNSASGTSQTARTGAEAGGFSRSGSGLFFQYISDNLLAQLDMLERQNRATTISTPMLSASNNSPARLFVGTEAVLARGFSSETTTGTTGATSTSTETEVELREVGQTLEILPRINADDTVTLVIQQEASTVISGGGRVPVIGDSGSLREVQVDTVDTARVGGTITAKTETTIAVGGLIRDSGARGSEKSPVLGNIPLLGLMFRGDTSKKDRSELVLLITPHIYSAGPEGERLARARLARNSQNVLIDTEGFAGSTKGAPKVSLRGQQQNYIPMTRFAAAMRHGVKPADSGAYRGIVSAPIGSGGALSLDGRGGLKLFGGGKITAEAVESWRKRNLFVTAVVLTNTSGGPLPVNVNAIRGDWLAATAESQTLAARNQPGSRGYLYLISDRPWDEVIADLQAGGQL